MSTRNTGPEPVNQRRISRGQRVLEAPLSTGPIVLTGTARSPLTDGRRKWQRRGWRRCTMSKLLRVRVVEDGHPTVNVKVPIGVAKWGMKMAQAFSPQMKNANLDWDSISSMVQEGEQGKIVEVEDEADPKTVEVWVE